MATMREKIDALSKQGRPPAQGGLIRQNQDGVYITGYDAIDSKTGNKLNRSDTIPSYLKQLYLHESTKNDGKYQTPEAQMPAQTSEGQGVTPKTAAQQAVDSFNQGIDAEEKRRQRGLSANIVGGAATNLLGSPNLKRKSLIGF